MLGHLLDRTAAADNETRSGFIARAVRELLGRKVRLIQAIEAAEPQSTAPREIGEAQLAIVREVEKAGRGLFGEGKVRVIGAVEPQSAAAREIEEEIAERVLRRFRGETASTADRHH